MHLHSGMQLAYTLCMVKIGCTEWIEGNGADTPHYALKNAGENTLSVFPNESDILDPYTMLEYHATIKQWRIYD